MSRNENDNGDDHHRHQKQQVNGATARSNVHDRFKHDYSESQTKQHVHVD